jgi:hypothetical protein
MLFESPTHEMVSPLSEERAVVVDLASRSVWMSARICVGWYNDDRALMTGTDELRARSYTHPTLSRCTGKILGPATHLDVRMISNTSHDTVHHATHDPRSVVQALIHSQLDVCRPQEHGVST